MAIQNSMEIPLFRPSVGALHVPLDAIASPVGLRPRALLAAGLRFSEEPRDRPRDVAGRNGQREPDGIFRIRYGSGTTLEVEPAAARAALPQERGAMRHSQAGRAWTAVSLALAVAATACSGVDKSVVQKSTDDILLNVEAIHAASALCKAGDKSQCDNVDTGVDDIKKVATALAQKAK
jgi:hypothetical protein